MAGQTFDLLNKEANHAATAAAIRDTLLCDSVRCVNLFFSTNLKLSRDPCALHHKAGLQAVLGCRASRSSL